MYTIIDWDLIRASHYPMSEKRQKSWEVQERAKGNEVAAETSVDHNGVADDLSDLDDLDIEIKTQAKKVQFHVWLRRSSGGCRASLSHQGKFSRTLTGTRI